jgi:hypothetical protein
MQRETDASLIIKTNSFAQDDGAISRMLEGERTIRNILAKLVIGVAITAIGVFGADNSIGTWKYNVAKSKSNPPSKNPLKSETFVTEAIDDGVKVTFTGELQDGTPFNWGFSYKYDGKENPVIGGPLDTISMKQIDANHFTFEGKKTGGKYHITGRIVISKDGKTWTETFKGTNAEGQPYGGKLIYEKQ